MTDLVARLVLSCLVVAAAGCGGGPRLDWVRIPGGPFDMGSDDGGPEERPVHRVVVSAFEISRTAVTFGQYRACVRAGACSPPHLSDGTCTVQEGNQWQPGRLPARFQGDDHPVVCVDWDQANAFARWAGGRLPTEAEWEYAARGGGRARCHPWGDAPATCDRAVLAEAENGCGRNATWPVCSRPAGNTDHGLCDMAGNVWEWVQDWFHESYAGAPADGSAWEHPEDSDRVKRGGSWGTRPEAVRVSTRRRNTPETRDCYLGFRIARTVP